MAMGSERKARELGAWGAAPQYSDLWAYSKRELVEIALHLAARTTGSADEALESGEAGNVVRQEREALRSARFV